MENRVRGLDDYKRRLEIEQDGFQLISPELAQYMFWWSWVIGYILFR